jgi:hypothetical protein
VARKGRSLALDLRFHRAALSEIPAEQFPLSAAAASTIAGYISTEQYLWGLRRVLEGIVPR